MSSIDTNYGTIYNAAALSANPLAAGVPNTGTGNAYTTDAFGNLIPTSPGGTVITNQGGTVNAQGTPTSSGIGNALGSTAIGGTVSGAVSSVSGFISLLTTGTTWQRAGLVIVGIAFVVIALVIMGHGKQVIQMVRNAS